MGWYRWQAQVVAIEAQQAIWSVQLPWFSCPAGTLLSQVLPPVLAGTAQLQSQLSSESEACIQWYAAQPQPDGAFSTEHVEHYCMQLLSVLAQTLFRQRPSTLKAFGNVFWAVFVEQYQAAFLQQVQGSTVGMLQARQEAARQMEQQAVAMGLAEPGMIKEGLL